MSSSSSSSLLDQYMAALANGTNSANGSNGSSNANAVPDPASSSNSRIQNLVRNNNRNRTNSNPSANRGFASVHFTENRHRIRLCLDLPGVLSQDLSVQMQHGVLLIQGTRLLRRFSSLPSHLGSSSDQQHQEPICYRQQHKFCRRFAIDTDVVDANRIRANLDPRTGTLQIVAPKMDRPKALRIEVTNYALEENDDHQNQEEELEAMQEEEEEIMTEEVMAAADRAAAPTSLSKARSAQSIASTAAAVAALTVAAAAGEEQACKTNQDITTTESSQQQPVISSESSPSQQEQHQQVPLRNVVSMGSAADALEAAEAMVSVRRLLGNHHHSHHHSRSSMKSHLMMRRSMSNPKVNKIV